MSETQIEETETDTPAVEETLVPVYNVNDGVFGRDGGPYLDIEQEKAEERRRAIVEGRDPNFDDLLPGTGTQVVTAHQLVQTFNNTALAGQDKIAFEGDIKAPEKSIAVVVTPVDQEDDKQQVESGFGDFTPVTATNSGEQA